MRLFIAAATLALGLAAPALAALPVGATAPDFTTQASLAGKPIPFNLAAALKKGPVVLYFFPAAFTTGCTAEAHEFAEATDRFEKLGATVVGVSADDIETLNRFSVEACRNKFAVAAGSAAVIADYDVKLMPLVAKSNRTSYVVAPDGKIAFVHSNLSYKGHVEMTLAAMQAWHDAQKK
jgi:peroxiredoxin Q/BCP